MGVVNGAPIESARGPVGSIEHRVATPRADLVVVRVGKSKSEAVLRESEKSKALIGGIAKATRKPGISRNLVFRGRNGQRVYAYSVNPADTTMIVREDSLGRKTLGRFVGGKFRPVRSKTV